MSAWQNSVHQWANATMNRQTALALTTLANIDISWSGSDISLRQHIFALTAKVI